METMNIDSVFKEAERVFNTKRDFVVPAQKVDIDISQSGDLKLRFLGDPANMEYDISSIAHSQIAQKLDIPSGYYNRMLSADKPLLMANIKGWMPKYSAEDRRFLLRLLDGKVRGFLSSRYNCLDNYNLLQFIRTEALNNGAVNFQSVINDEGLYVKLLMPKQKQELIGGAGDWIQQGLIVKNSDVGKGALSITPFFLRLICSNGMIGQTNFRAIHLGNDRTEGEFISDRTKDIKALNIWSMVGDMVNACFKGDILDKYIKDMNRSKDVGFIHPVEEIQDIGIKYVIPKTDIKEITDRYINGSDASLFGLVNTMTDYAKTKEIEDQTDLEHKAYKVMIDLTKRKLGAEDIAINPSQNDQAI